MFVMKIIVSTEEILESTDKKEIKIIHSSTHNLFSILWEVLSNSSAYICMFYIKNVFAR